MSYGLAQTSRNLELTGVFATHPYPPIVVGASVFFPFAGTFEEGILLAYDETNQRFAPYDAATTGVNVPQAVLLVPVTATAPGAQTASIGVGVAYFDRLKQGQALAVLNQPQTTTSLPAHRRNLAMARGLFIISR